MTVTETMGLTVTRLLGSRTLKPQAPAEGGTSVTNPHTPEFLVSLPSPYFARGMRRTYMCPKPNANV